MLVQFKIEVSAAPSMGLPFRESRRRVNPQAQPDAPLEAWAAGTDVQRRPNELGGQDEDGREREAGDGDRLASQGIPAVSDSSFTYA